MGGVCAFATMANGTMTVGYPGLADRMAPDPAGNRIASSLSARMTSSMPCAPDSAISLARFGQRLHRRGGSEAREPFVEIALHPIFEDHRAPRIHALWPIGAPADLPAQETPAGISVDHARNVSRVDNDGTPFLENRDDFGHRLRLLGVQPAARLLQARRRGALIIER